MSTYDNLNVELIYNKDGFVDQRSLKKFERAEIVRKQLEKYDNYDKIYLHHTSKVGGYISRKNGLKARKYNGRFGVGYVVDIPNFNNKSRNHERRYYIFKDTDPEYVNPFDSLFL